MKSTKPSYKSFKKIVSKNSLDSNLSSTKDFGLTLIPIGSDNLFVGLPNLRDTYTYNIINTAEMTGNITLKTSGGASLRGLVLNTVNNQISITPISQGTTEFEIGSDVKDGCFVETLSNGDSWFIWSVATNGSLGIGQNGNGPGAGTGYSPPPAPVVVNPITSTTTFPPSAGSEARHALAISGTAEPESQITITEESDLIAPITIDVDENGFWDTDQIIDLENGDYAFTFTPSVGAAAVDREVATDNGVLSFVTPESFTVERGQNYDFTTGASATDTNNVNITPFNVDSTQYNTGLAHGATFDIIYSFTHNATPYSRTVSGVVEDTIAPTQPTIVSATFDTVNINDFTATGAAEDGASVEVFLDGVSQGTVTSVGGTWTFTKTFVFNQTFDIVVQASDAAGNVSDESLPTSVTFSPPTLTRPTLAIDNAPINTWTNQDNPIEISGTTDAGSTIIVKDGNQIITPVTGPTYNGGLWTAEINVANESNSSLTAEASQANFNSPSPSTTKTLLVDRVDPIITLTGGAQTVYLGNIDSSNDAGFSVSDARSGVATQTSNWDTQVSPAEGSYTVTYNATDFAGNSANAVTRTVNVSTQVVVPTNIEATASSLEAVVTGDVTGTYADNLSVKIYVIDSYGMEEVYQENNVDVEFQVTNGTFSATLTLSAGDYTFEASTVNSVDEESTQSSATSLTIVTGAGGGTSEVGIPSIIDEVYNDPSSTIVGSPTLTNSILEITEDQYIINGDIAEYMYQDYLSISFWIKSTENTQDAVNKFVSLGWAHSGNQKFAHVIGNQTSSPYNGFRVITPSGGVIDEAVPSGDWNDEQWHMLTLTWDNIDGEKKFYYDGQQLGSTVTFNSKSDPFRDGDDVYGLIIGTGTGTAGGIRAGEAFRGKMTNMVINNFIWTDQEVSDLYNAGFDNQITIERTDLFLEDLSGLAIVGNATVSSGIFSRNNGHGGQHGATFNLETEGVVDFNSDGTRVDEELTVSFWFRPDQTWANNWRYVGGNAQDSNNEFRLATSLLGNGNLEFRCIFFNNQQKFGSSTSALNVGEWYHLAVTYSQNASNPSNHDLKMFVNGEKVSETLNLSNNLLKKITDRTFGIGGYSSGGNISGNTLDHSSDSWQIASGTALAESQVVAIYNQTDRQMTIAEAAALPVFIEQSATLFGDATITNCTLHLDGNGDYATVSDGFRYTDSISISLWFKTSVSTSRIISSHIAGSGNNGFFIGLTNGTLKYRTPDQTSQISTGPGGLANDAWHHVVVTWENNSRKLYVDNSLQHTQNAGGTATGYVAGQPLYIGAINNVNSGPYDFFDGEISRVEVLNQVLSPTEVTTRYNAGNGAC